MSDQHVPEGVETVRLLWTDLHGVARGISMPVDRYEGALDEGVGFANGIAEVTLEPGLLEDPKYGPQHGDMLAVPDPDSLMAVDWREGAAVVASDLTTVDGRPFDLCGRSVLQSVLDDLRSEGYHASVGVEVEFSLLAPGEDGWVPYNDRSSYDLSAVDRADDLVGAWTDALRAGYAYLQEHGKVGCQALVKDVYSEHTTGCSNSRAWWRYILSDRTFDNLRRDRRPAECITASVR